MHIILLLDVETMNQIKLVVIELIKFFNYLTVNLITNDVTCQVIVVFFF